MDNDGALEKIYTELETACSAKRSEWKRLLFGFRSSTGQPIAASTFSRWERAKETMRDNTLRALLTVTIKDDQVRIQRFREFSDKFKKHRTKTNEIDFSQGESQIPYAVDEGFVEILVHKSAAFQQLVKPTSKNLGRAKYFGFHGFRNWVDVTEDEAYENAQPKLVAENCAKTILDAQLQVRSLVSMGPGDGTADAVLYRRLSSSAKISYIPVDISPGLLIRSIKTLDDEENANVRLGILGDFEKHVSMESVISQLRRRTEWPILYSMCGNTFGNLDEPEDKFAEACARAMSADDYFLIHVVTHWHYSKDVDEASYKVFDAQKKILARPIADLRGAGTFSEVVKKFDELVHRKHVEDKGPVPDTKAVKFTYENTNCPVLTIKRYNLWNLVDAFEHWGFQVMQISEWTTAEDFVTRTLNQFREERRENFAEQQKLKIAGKLDPAKHVLGDCAILLRGTN